MRPPKGDRFYGTDDDFEHKEWCALRIGDPEAGKSCDCASVSDDVFVLKHSTGELHSVKATKEAAEVIAAKFELTVERYVPERKVMGDDVFVIFTQDESLYAATAAEEMARAWTEDSSRTYSRYVPAERVEKAMAILRGFINRNRMPTTPTVTLIEATSEIHAALEALKP